MKAWVTASPTDGEANKAVMALIAKRLGIAPSKVELVSGQTARDKGFVVSGMDLEAVMRRLAGEA